MTAFETLRNTMNRDNEQSQSTPAATSDTMKMQMAIAADNRKKALAQNKQNTLNELAMGGSQQGAM